MTSPKANCFGRGTLIDTPNGEKTIETIASNDLILSASGDQLTVRFVFRQTIDLGFAPPERNMPICISAHTFGPGQPHTDLFLTADHAVYLGEALCQTGALMNNHTVDRVAQIGIIQRYTVYHLDTGQHELIRANGMITETFFHTDSLRAFDNYADFLESDLDKKPITHMPLNRVKQHKDLPHCVQETLFPTQAS